MDGFDDDIDNSDIEWLDSNGSFFVATFMIFYLRQEADYLFKFSIRLS